MHLLVLLQAHGEIPDLTRAQPLNIVLLAPVERSPLELARVERLLLAYGRLQVEEGRVQVLGHEVALRDLERGHTGVVVVPGRDAWRDKQVMVGWLTVVFAEFLLLGCSPQAGEMVVAGQLNDDLVPVLTEDVKVDSVRCVAPELEIFVARPRVDV